MRSPEREDRPDFILDEMLGSLSRWLRIMGYDAIYCHGKDDADVLRTMDGNQRWLLTRDKQLAERAGERGVYVPFLQLDAQLMFVKDRFGVVMDEHLSRCAACNGELDTRSSEEVEGLVPPTTLDEQDVFYVCRTCGKVYWKGGHWVNINEKMDSLGLRIGPGNNPR